jgi:hypothetical protein
MTKQERSKKVWAKVFERFGRQQGGLRGPNPRKHGWPSHHPLVAMLAEAHFPLHGWLRSGNCGTARGVVEFLKESLALSPMKHAICVVRADTGFLTSNYWVFSSSAGCPTSLGAVDALAEARCGARQFVAGSRRELRGG